MPRRGTEVVQLPMPAKKKTKLAENPSPSLDVSFCDDEALPPGIVFSDIQKKKWRLGKPIGRGSFGRIYLASDDVEKEVTKLNARYVVKIEPFTNGPLFVEIHCLMCTAQVQKVKLWRQRNKQKRLGMPVYIASGSFTDEGTGIRYRFLVLPRYDIDLQKVIARTKVLDLKNVLVLAIQILDVLEYLHSYGYTHCDIKSSNLMLGFDGGKHNKVSLVKSVPSFQKETKEVAVLSGKPRRPKCAKSRSSNYYDDEDFVVKEMGDSEGEDMDHVKKKLRKILSDKESRTMHRHHAFNLRQLSNYVNYEDMNSSVCSDQSYQKLLDDFGSKSFMYPSEEFKGDVKHNDKNTDPNLNEIYEEAVLSQSNGQVYLLDYGLASKFVDSEGNHKVFAVDARRAHDGTLEYSSRDSHDGAHSRRSDMETLGYNLLDWLTGTLPWKRTEVLAEPELVHAIKKNYMSDVKSFLKTCFKTEFYPPFMEKYLQYVTSLEFTDKPDYEYCRSLFKSELLKNGYNKDMCLNFAEASLSPMSRKLCYSKRFGKKNTPPDFLARNGIKKAYERENVCSLENDLKLELLKQTLNSSSDGLRKPCTSRNFFISDADLVARLKKSLMPHDVFGKKLSPKNLRSQKKKIKKRRGIRKHRNSIGKFGNFMGSARQFTWAEILAGNPEDIIRKERNMAAAKNDEEEDFDEEDCKFRIRKLSNASESSDTNLQSPLLRKDYLENKNPTYAMKEQFENFNKKVSGKIHKESDEVVDELKGYTLAMVKVYKAKEKREARERAEQLKQQFLNKEPVVVLNKEPKGTKIKKNGKRADLRRSTRQKTSSESSIDDISEKAEKKVERNKIRQKSTVETKTNEVKCTRKTRKTPSDVSQSSTNYISEKAEKKVEKNKRGQKSIVGTKSNEEKCTRSNTKASSDEKSDSGTDRSSKATRTSRKTRQNISLESEIDRSDAEPARYTRKNNSKVTKMDVDEKNNCTITENSKSKSTKTVSKKEVKIVEKTLPTVICKKCPARARFTPPAPNNRRRLRSSRRNRN